jgi:methyl-accepting chemotaxis protein
MGIWNKIKSLFDFNKDGKFTAEDLVVAQALADKKIKEANEAINETVTEVKERVERVKEEIQDVKETVKEVASQASDVVAAAKGKKRAGRKPTKKK